MPNLSKVILPELPFLRRFARSMTGRQESGDAYVASVLEAIIADPSVFPKDQSPRCALYHVFLKTWESVSINHRPEIAETNGRVAVADRRLDALAPRARQAFLLVAVEGFSAVEGSQILGVSLGEFKGLIDQASREIAEQVATEILIIEDEPLIAMDLESIVTSIGHVVQGIARTRSEAVAAFRANRPSLILADIQLADGSSGLDAVNDVLGDAPVPVIFITAFPEQLLTGLRPEPTFLIPKPFRSETVKAVISQALFFDMKARAQKAA